MISLIAVSYNHFEDITKPFLANFPVPGVELILVNNGTKLPKLDIKGLTVIETGKNLGYGRALNLGYKSAQGEIICFLNNDLTFESGWDKKIVQAVKENPNALMGPMLVDSNNATLFRDRLVPYLNGWCVFAKREVFDSIKEEEEVWDGNFFLYFEDVELSERASLKGHPLLQVDIGIKHLGSKSSDTTNISEETKRSYQHYTNKLTQMHLEKSGKKRVVFYYPNAFGFIDEDYEGKGVGGADSSIIQFSRELVKRGYQVEIYNPTTKSGTFNGVEYHHLSEFRPLDYCDIFILFRATYKYLEYVNALTKIFWSCDQYTNGYWPEEIFPFVDKVVCISPYHQRHLEMIHEPPKDLLTYIDLGIKAEDYTQEVNKISGRLIYCSVPARGLMNLARLFPLIKEQVPEATLVITSDYRLWGTEDPLNIEFRDEFANKPGVTFLGKVSRAELVKNQLEAEVMAYPCNYEECFCISAMECMAAGAIPVTSSIGALKTTVGKSGILLSNIADSSDYDKPFVDSVVQLLTDNTKASRLRTAGKRRALTHYSWKAITDKWEELFKQLGDKGEEMIVCKKCDVKMANAYNLSKHIAKKHADDIELPEEIEVENKVVMHLLRFNRQVECNINGNKFEGTEIQVPSDLVHAVLETIQSAYGPDILAV